MYNHYSVTMADVLYLCNTTGYLDRYTYMIGILIWAKRHGYNLLVHRRPQGQGFKPQNSLDCYYSTPEGPL